VVYHARKLYVHVASAFPLARYYRILVPEFLQHDGAQMKSSTMKTVVCPETAKTDPVKFLLRFSLGNWMIGFSIPKNFFEQNTTRKCG